MVITKHYSFALYNFSLLVVSFSSTPPQALKPFHLPCFSLPAPLFPPYLRLRPTKNPERNHPFSLPAFFHTLTGVTPLYPDPKTRLLLGVVRSFLVSERAGKKSWANSTAQTPWAERRRGEVHDVPSNQCARAHAQVTWRGARSLADTHTESSLELTSFLFFLSTWTVRETKISPCVPVCVWERRGKSKTGLSGKNMEELPEQGQTVSQPLGISVNEHKIVHHHFSSTVSSYSRWFVWKKGLYLSSPGLQARLLDQGLHSITSFFLFTPF